jgi:hypothetical protein
VLYNTRTSEINVSGEVREIRVDLGPDHRRRVKVYDLNVTLT